MKALRSASVLGVGGFVFAVACSGSSAGGSCAAYFDKLIAFFNQCGSTSFLNTSQRDAFIAYCNEIGGAPGASGFASQVDTCTSKLDPSTCSAISCSIRGTLPGGTACANSVQCQSGQCSVTGTSNPTSELQCGTCDPVAPQGSDCTNAVCDPGFYCNTTSKQCTAQVAQGGACTSGNECSTGLLCDTQSKTCVPPPTKGQACSVQCAAPYACINSVCADRVPAGGSCPTGNECQSGLTCNFQTHLCETVPVAKAGEACGFINNQYIQCDSTLVCANGTCAAPKQQGATCVVGNHECALNLVCVSGTCQVPDFSSCK